MVYLKNFRLRRIDDDFDTKVIDDVTSHGFHIIGISENGDFDSAEYGFTVGCYYSFGIPEAVLHGMRYQPMKNLLWSYVSWARNHLPIQSPMITDDLANLPIMLRTVHPTWHGPLLGYANWFYKDLGSVYPCVQVAWPDEEGIFDTELGFDEKLRSIQPNMSLPHTGAA